MKAIARLAEDLMEQVGGAVNDEVLLDEVGVGVDAAEDLDDAEAVEGAVGVPDGIENSGGALAGGFVALFGGETIAELALEGGDMAGGEELLAGADAEVEVTGRLFFEDEAERSGGGLC